MRANGSQEGFMENAPGVKDRVVVVTGAARGMGRPLVLVRFIAERMTP
jgi:hypothetical protein